MTDLDALFRAILEQPYDDTIRLIFADLLEESGDCDRAAYIRHAIRYHNLQLEPCACTERTCPVCEEGGYRDPETNTIECRTCDGTGTIVDEVCERCKGMDEANRICRDLHTEERCETWLGIKTARMSRLAGENVFSSLSKFATAYHDFFIQRGFVYGVECTLDFRWNKAMYGEIFRRWPVTHISVRYLWPSPRAEWQEDVCWYPDDADERLWRNGSTDRVDAWNPNIGVNQRLDKHIAEYMAVLFPQCLQRFPMSHAIRLGFPDAETALTALSHTYVSMGREWAGLPPLPVPNLFLKEKTLAT